MEPIHFRVWRAASRSRIGGRPYLALAIDLNLLAAGIFHHAPAAGWVILIAVGAAISLRYVIELASRSRCLLCNVSAADVPERPQALPAE